MSTTQGTLLTERSSVMTKSSSVTSYAGADEPSVEDVMGMYERGFRDDSDVEDNEESRPPTAGSSLSRRGAQILEAMNEPLPVPTFARSIAGASHVQVRDSAAMFRNSGLPSSLPKGVGNLDYHMGGGSVPKYDSDTESIKMFRAATKLAAPSGLSRREEDLRDRYGFKKQTQHVTLEQYEAWNEQYTAYLSRRRRKWVALMKDCGLMTESPDRFPPRSAKTKRFVRKGIPPEWRGAAWFYYAGGPAIVAKHPGLYDELTRKRAKDVDIELIERDLHRTFPDNIKFRPQRNAKASSANRPDTTDASFDDSDADAAGPEPPIITSLRRVLQAFSIYNPRIGYCQSLNFLAGLLLLFVQTEEQAFWLLNVITRLYLPGTHEMSLEGSRIDLGVLMAELKEALPQVWAKIAGELDGTTGAQTATADRERDSKKRRSSSRRKESQPPASRSGAGLSSAGDRAGPGNVERLPPITLCMTAWFMSCFIGTLPIETTLRVWDVFFYEGSKTLFRIALAIFKLGEAEIRAVSDPMEMFGVVQAIPRRILDANLLMETCFRRRGGFGGLSQETIERGRRERREAGKRGSASTDGTTANSNAGEVSANNDDAVAASAAAEVKRKGTLFGRRKERGREREREVEAL